MTAGLRWTPEQLAAFEQKAKRTREELKTTLAGIAALAPPPAKPRKYRNEPVLTPQGRFDSKKEHDTWLQLRELERTGEISNLERQVRYAIVVNGVHVCDYIADFRYRDGAATRVVDVKSDATRKLPVYRLKRELMKAVHRIDIDEV